MKKQKKKCSDQENGWSTISTRKAIVNKQPAIIPTIMMITRSITIYVLSYIIACIISGYIGKLVW